MEIRVPYGRATISAEARDDIRVDVIDLPPAPAVSDPAADVRRALDDPLGVFDWATHRTVGSVAVAINDRTRPVPHDHLLPPLMDHITGLGVPDDAVTFYIAVGGHPPMSSDEFAAVVPSDVLRRYRVVSHDSERGGDLAWLGETPWGTPVWSNRGYVDADFKVVVGTIEPHQFAGFSGGVKSAAIGLAGPATINANHTLMVHPDSRIGTYAGNPARQDVEEIGRMIGVDLAVNVILDRRREIVQTFAGDPVAVMEAGVPTARRICQVEVQEDYGLVIASPGGHPKDIDVYQSQKAVASASRITRPGGTIILTAACPAGAGSSHYEEWVADKRSRREVVDAFRREGFRVGPHKAFQLARDTEHVHLSVCSEMSDALAERLLLEPAADFQAAIDAGVGRLSAGDRIAVLPHASTTVATLASEGDG